MPDAAQKIARAWLRASLEKRAEGGTRYNLFDSVPDADRKRQLGGIFDSPGAKEPAPKPPGRGIFDSPGGAPRAPTPAPRAQPAPPKPPEPPPAAPAPPAAAPPPPAPAAPQPPRAQPKGPDLKGLKRDRKFKTFLQEKHQGGRRKVPHPKPQLRRRYRDGIQFWTAMKYPEFHGGVIREFEAWKQQAGGGAAAGRQVGQKVGDLDQLRVGDVIQSGRKDAPRRQVLQVQTDRAELQVVDAKGAPVGDAGWYPLRILHDHKLLEQGAKPPVKPVVKAPAKPKKPKKPKSDAIKIPPDEKWRERDARLLEIARDGEFDRNNDVPLGETGVNGAVTRRMKLPDGSEHDFVFKAKSEEKGWARNGTPELAPREAAAYEIDQLLGDGRVVPPSLRRTGPGGGAYQAFVPGAKSLYDDSEEGSTLAGIPTRDLVRHPQIQRMTVLDALIGHEDRHAGNVMFSWADPSGPKTADNLRFHAIDNGYALAETSGKEGAAEDEMFDIRDPWLASTNWRESENIRDRWQIQKGILSEISPELHEQLKQVDPAKMAETMVRSGIRDAGAIQAALVRLIVMQENPKVVGSFISRRKDDDLRRVPGPWAQSASVKGQKDWQRQSHLSPEKLLRDHTDLPPQALADLKKIVREALG